MRHFVAKFDDDCGPSTRSSHTYFYGVAWRLQANAQLYTHHSSATDVYKQHNYKVQCALFYRDLCMGYSVWILLSLGRQHPPLEGCVIFAV